MAVKDHSRSSASTTKLTVALGLVLTTTMLLYYLFNPSLIQFFNFKATDAVLAGKGSRQSSGDIVIVDIDERSLAEYGQWPWPRYRLGNLLLRIQSMGAKSVGLDIMLAEPDRTSPGTWLESINRELGCRATLSGIPAELSDHDAILSDILAGGPFVLGYEFLFDAPGVPSAHCRLHPLNLIRIEEKNAGKPIERFFKAKDVVCNLPGFSGAVSHSGFLNAAPDPDGILRRIPLIMAYGEQVFPSLALGTLMQAWGTDRIRLRQTKRDQQYLMVGNRTLPLDGNGNILIDFFPEENAGSRVSAGTILDGQAPEGVFRDKIVFIGTTAAGVGHDFQTAGKPVFHHLDLQARIGNTILTEAFIVRNRETLVWEAATGFIIALLYSLCLAKLGAFLNSGIGILCIAGSWIGAALIFRSSSILVSPLFPTLVVLFNYSTLTIFKYRRTQYLAREKEKDALMLLTKSEKKLTSIIKTIPDIVFRLDTKGRITFMSPSIATYDSPAEELTGRYLLDLVLAEDREKAAFRINERRTGERATKNMELRFRLSLKGAKQREPFRYFSVSAEGLYSGESPCKGSFMGTQGIARDITDHKILLRQLVQAQKMEAVGSLAAGVAHDLNNVLSTLVGYPELILMDLPEDSPHREPLSIIEQSGLAAAAIVRDMMTIARRGVNVTEVFCINSILSEYLDSAVCKGLKENYPLIRIESDPAPDLLNIKGSPHHLFKAIMNLAGNAVEAMPAGGRVLLQTSNRYFDTPRNAYETIPEGEYVRLSVIDEGVGISGEDLKKIFEPFYTKKRMGRSGTGLGMSVVWGTVKDHGGYIDIKSREGEGTRFDIHIPATRMKAAEKRGRISLEDYVGAERILVVDDVAEQSDIAVKMLGKLGYSVASVPSGEAAVEYMKTRTVDLLVLDMVMHPGMDGLETYQQIIRTHPGQKAIIASGFSETDRVKSLQALGAGGYVRKPYTLEKIGVAVREELDS